MPSHAINLTNENMERIREDSAEASSIETKFRTLTLPQTPMKQKNRSKNTRRFSDEQIRLLESIFVSESTKLEPMKKLQVAAELGLQPRQVAIWFQNKRARWKSKQIEQDYAKLKANYDCLASRFESLKKEKDSLLAELQKLNEKMKKADDLIRLRSYNKGEHESSKLSFMEEGLENDKGLIHLQEKNNINGFEEQYGYEGHEFPNVERINNSLTSSEKWFGGGGGGDYGGGDLNSGRLLDPSTSSGSQWLNCWPV